MKPEDLDVGDTFYECYMGMNVEMIVETKPSFEDNQWRWTAKNQEGNIQDYLITKGYEHYGPKIYSQPQYVKIFGCK